MSSYVHVLEDTTITLPVFLQMRENYALLGFDGPFSPYSTEPFPSHGHFHHHNVRKPVWLTPPALQGPKRPHPGSPDLFCSYMAEGVRWCRAPPGLHARSVSLKTYFRSGKTGLRAVPGVAANPRITAVSLATHGSARMHYAGQPGAGGSFCSCRDGRLWQYPAHHCG